MSIEAVQKPRFILVSTNTPEESGLLMVRRTVLRCLEEIGLPYIIVHGGMPDTLLQEYLQIASGIVIPGGPDIQSIQYGEQPHSKNDTPDLQRDILEFKLLRWADEFDLPILAICRGLQMMAIEDDATLIQHLPDVVTDEVHGKEEGVYAGLYAPEAQQKVILERGNRLLEQILQKYLPADFPVDQLIEVYIKSMHHQAVREETLHDLVVVGRSEKGVVEVVVHPDKKFWLAFQGHLEADIAETEYPPVFLRAVLHAFKEAVNS